MKSHDYLPKAFGPLASWLINFFKYLTPSLQRFEIPEGASAPAQEKADIFQAAHEKAEHPNAGKADRLDRKEKAEAASKSVRDFVNVHLRYNKAVTDDDRIQLGLHVPDAIPTHAAAPTTWPLATVRIAGPRQVRLDWHDSASEAKAKPIGVRGCEIRYSVLDTPPTTTDDLQRSEFSSRASHILKFDEAQRGKTIYIILRWDSTRGDKGPWSEIISTIIP
ncbi:MAG: hypothetical protein LBC98_06565 [Prevotellaceae bacterium]|jgi:hypothetical protein|nr:hypothetical protein [Prevotellaceae bacterium]